MNEKNSKLERIVMGDYVFTPIKNQFNSNIAYWLSKRDCTLAMYCFTVYDDIDLQMQNSKSALMSYIRCFEFRQDNLDINIKEYM